MRPPPSCGAGPDGKGPCLAREGMRVRVPGSMPLGEAEGRVPVSAGKPTVTQTCGVKIFN